MIPASFSAVTQGRMQANSCAEHPTHAAPPEGNGSVYTAAKEATFPTVWASWLTSALKCASPIFSAFENSCMESLVSNSMAFLKAFPSSWDTPQFFLQLSKLSNELKRYWESREDRPENGQQERTSLLFSACHQYKESGLPILPDNMTCDINAGPSFEKEMHYLFFTKRCCKKGL